jgi:hypothetical protein
MNVSADFVNACCEKRPIWLPPELAFRIPRILKLAGNILNPGLTPQVSLSVSIQPVVYGSYAKHDRLF